MYERSHFFPKKKSESEFLISENTVSIHKMSATWLTERQKKRGSNKFWINVCRPILRIMQNACIKVLGGQKAKIIETKIRNLLK